MNDESLLPRRLIVLGEAMRPVWQKLEAELDASTWSNTPVLDMVATVQYNLSQLEAAVHRLTERINDLMGEVVANEAASDSEVYRAVGRFEAPLRDVLTSYHSVQALEAYGANAEARDLLADVYRHSLIEIRDWLYELIETLADPMAAVKKRGLPTSGYVELPLTLELTAAPGLAGLSRWAERHSLALFPARREPKTGLGFWGTVGAVALGWGIGEALFGDDDCGTGGA